MVFLPPGVKAQEQRSKRSGAVESAGCDLLHRQARIQAVPWTSPRPTPVDLPRPLSGGSAREEARMWFEKSTFGQLVDLAAERWGDREALCFEGRRWSFAQFRDETD